MQAINLSNQDTLSFSHSDPVMAFTYIHCQQTNTMSQLHFLSEAQKQQIKDRIRKGQHGFHFGDWSIPFTSMEKSS